jgi:acetylglutamate kinase
LERRDLEKLRTETTNVQAIKGKIEKYLTSKFDKDLSKALSKIGEDNDVVISAKADKDMTKFFEFLEIF